MGFSCTHVRFVQEKGCTNRTGFCDPPYLYEKRTRTNTALIWQVFRTSNPSTSKIPSANPRHLIPRRNTCIQSPPSLIHPTYIIPFFFFFFNVVAAITVDFFNCPHPDLQIPRSASLTGHVRFVLPAGQALNLTPNSAYLGLLRSDQGRAGKDCTREMLIDLGEYQHQPLHDIFMPNPTTGR